MPQAPDPITAAPPLPWQPWDISTNETVAGWVNVKSGPADGTGHVSGEFEDGPSPWKQT